jgi:hypothetical protein
MILRLAMTLPGLLAPLTFSMCKKNTLQLKGQFTRLFENRAEDQAERAL